MRDHAHLQVLEAILVTVVLLGATYAVVTLRVPASDTDRTRERLQVIARDALVILAGLDSPRGSLLDLGVTEALHCVADATAPGQMCLGNRSANLSLRIESYLPEGTGYALILDNGIAPRELYRSAIPAGEAVASTHSYGPDWNMTFVTTELSCYEPSMDVNGTLVPVWHGAVANLTAAKVRTGAGADIPAEKASRAGWWNFTLPGATRGAADTLVANVTAKRGTLPGNASYASCDLAGLGPVIRQAARSSTLSVAMPMEAAPLGGEARFAFDVSALSGLGSVTLHSANLTIFEPISPRNVSSGYAVADVLRLTGTSGVATWRVPHNALYGAHPVLMRAKMSVTLPLGGTADVEARIPALLHVAMPSGTIPIDPPYSVAVQAWFPDWR